MTTWAGGGGGGGGGGKGGGELGRKAKKMSKGEEGFIIVTVGAVITASTRAPGPVDVHIVSDGHPLPGGVSSSLRQLGQRQQQIDGQTSAPLPPVFCLFVFSYLSFFLLLSLLCCCSCCQD